jgi:Alginate export
LKASLVANDWWLASATDGLYNSSGALVARVAAGTAGTHVGEEIDAQTAWAVNQRIQLGGGIGHIFPGGFLKRATPGNPYTFPYLMFGYAF